MAMYSFGDRELCREGACRDRERVLRLQERLSAHRWLQQFKTDHRQMLALRSLLWQESSRGHPGNLSDEEVIDQITEMLVSGRLHVHPRSKPLVPAVSAPATPPAVVPFPLADSTPK
jgi:hypothetical protein